MHPHFGFAHGLAVHKNVVDHLPEETRYQRFNKKLALWIVSHVGTMTCFYAFNVLSVLSLPATLTLATIIHPSKAGWIGFVCGYGFIFLIQWICQNWIQLILLPALMVGQNLQNAASDARAAKQFQDTETIADRLDTNTQGGITDILEAISKLDKKIKL